LYNHTKQEEDNLSWQVKSSLPELIVKKFDVEQIWQQIHLQNDGSINRLVKDISSFAFKQPLYFLDSNDNGSNDESGRNGDISGDEGEDMFPEEDGDDDDNDLLEDDERDLALEGDEDELSDSDDDDVEGFKKKSAQFTSEVDDEFFKLCEMDDFCDEMEKADEKSRGNLGVDLFKEEKEDEGRELIRYKDFFEPSKAQKLKKDAKKRVTFNEEGFSGDEEDNDEASAETWKHAQDEQNESGDEDEGPKSSFQSRQIRLKEKIKDLEDEAMKEKPWHLKGEISSGGRPQNSLLEEYVDFDRAARPAPVFTEKTTLRLEDIIRQRVKDKSWDDVMRKVMHFFRVTHMVPSRIH